MADEWDGNNSDDESPTGQEPSTSLAHDLSVIPNRVSRAFPLYPPKGLKTNLLIEHIEQYLGFTGSNVLKDITTANDARSSD